MAIPQGTLNAGWVCRNGRLPKTKGVGQHAGMVGQHAGMVGQHEQEWWVNGQESTQNALKAW
jgi:hypothetical protein